MLTDNARGGLADDTSSKTDKTKATTESCSSEGCLAQPWKRRPDWLDRGAPEFWQDPYSAVFFSRRISLPTYCYFCGQWRTLPTVPSIFQDWRNQ